MLVWAGLLAALGAQAIVGEVQYRNALPWGLVLAHVVLAAAIWTLFVALSVVLSRPPAALVAARHSRKADTADPSLEGA